MTSSLTNVTRRTPAGGQNGSVHVGPATTTASGRPLRPLTPAIWVGLLGLVAVIETLLRPPPTGSSGMYVVLLCLLGLAGTLPLALPNPVAGAAVITAAAMLSLAVFTALTLAGLAAQLLAAYRLGRRWSSPAAMLLGIPYLVLALVSPPYSPVIAQLLAGSVPVLVGFGMALRVRSDAVNSQAVQDAYLDTLLEHSARGERARIARELHDVVAHHISIIAVQAETARLTVPDMPAAGAKRLLAIGDTARAALTEMRRLLGVLRDDTSAGPAETGPQPGLDQLNDLLDEAREVTGTGTRLILTGRPVALDPGVELAAYRIVQEALTNARRHATGAAIDVEMHYTPSYLRLLIRDNGPGLGDLVDGGDGPARPGNGTGHGLTGMRERAAAVGGRLRSGSGAAGGFLIEAMLPADNRPPR
ncbi:MAG: sensor histidine kinase [Nakamurella sp.]